MQANITVAILVKCFLNFIYYLSPKRKVRHDVAPIIFRLVKHLLTRAYFSIVIRKLLHIHVSAVSGNPPFKNTVVHIFLPGAVRELISVLWICREAVFVRFDFRRLGLLRLCGRGRSCGVLRLCGRSVRTVCAGVAALLVDTVTAGLVVVDLVVSGIELVADSVSDSVGASTVVSELSLKIWTLYSFSPAS